MRDHELFSNVRLVWCGLNQTRHTTELATACWIV
jgi:hypothetical protein